MDTNQGARVFLSDIFNLQILGQSMKGFRSNQFEYN